MNFLVALDGNTPIGGVINGSIAHTRYPVGVTLHPAIYCTSIDWGIAPGVARLTHVVNPAQPAGQPDRKLLVAHSSIAFVVENPDAPAAHAASGSAPPVPTGSLH